MQKSKEEHRILDVVDILAVPEGDSQGRFGKGLGNKAIVGLKHILQDYIEIVNNGGVH